MKCKTLDIWKRSASLSAQIYHHFSNCKDYGFKDQITRSGLSVPSNIAEGVERSSDKETIRFLDIARASLAEVQTQIYIGIKIDYIPNALGQTWIKEFDEIGRMLSSFIQKIEEK
ncbi:MAG TPA: four helix bundle protein [Helicobacteraceae bacterium]|nr:four helix bundle protein [Helicobacteraceae bacterium]